MFKHTFFGSILLLCFGQLFAQPTNDHLCDATVLTVDASCFSSAYTLDGATREVGEPTGSCLFDTTQVSVWFQFVAPPSGIVMATANLPQYHTGRFLDMVLYEATDEGCDFDNLTEVRCNTGETPSGAIERLPTITQAVTPGQTYYLQLTNVNFSEDEDIPAEFCVQVQAMYPPTNDNRCDALPLTLDEATYFKNTGATVEPEDFTLAPPVNFMDFLGTTSWGFGAIPNSTVWFTFESPATGGVVVDLVDFTPLGNFNSRVAVYAADDCGEVSADDLVGAQNAYGLTNTPDNPFGGGSTIIFQNRLQLGCLAPNQTYYILVSGNDNFLGTQTNATGVNNIVVRTFEPEPLVIEPLIVDVTCPGESDGSIAVYAFGGADGGRNLADASYTYAWSNGATTALLTDLEPGAYTLTVTDACGEETVETFQVGQLETFVFAGPDLSVTAGSDVQLEGTIFSGNRLGEDRYYYFTNPGFGFGSPSGAVYRTSPYRPEDPGVQVSNIDTLPFMEAISYGNDGIYMIDVNSDTDDDFNFLGTLFDLYYLDLASGETELIASETLPGEDFISFVDAQYNPLTGSFWVLMSDNTLYGMDPATGTLTEVQTFDDAGLLAGFVIDEFGTVFIVDAEEDDLETRVFEADLATGELIFIGAVPIINEVRTSMEFALDPGTTELYIYNRISPTSTSSTGVFIRLDLSSGLFSNLSLINPNLPSPARDLTIAPRTEAPFDISWTPADLLDDPTDQFPIATVDETTTFTLNVTDFCGETYSDDVTITVGESGADLELQLFTDGPFYEQYTIKPFAAVLINTGSEVATNVQVRVPLPEGTVHSGNFPDDGTSYSLFNGIWTIPELGVGEEVVLELLTFPLVSDQPVSLFVQVMTSDQNDPDSTPGNDTDQTPDEDDEAGLTVTDGANALVGPSDPTATGSAMLFPSPATSEVNVRFEGERETRTELQIFAADGRLVHREPVTAFAGRNRFQVDVAALPPGQYSLRIGAGGAALPFVKR